MNYIFYQTKTKFTNTGDALINKALIETLRRYGKLYANCSSDIPNSFIEELGISKEEKVTVSSEVSFVKLILEYSRMKRKEDNVYLFSGLGDSYGGNLKQVMRNIMSSLIIALFRLSGVKIVRIGRSIGPMSKSMQLSEKFRSLFLTYNYVRDSKTIERCRNYGIRNVEYCPDMSWLYDRKGIRSINATNTIMVNLRNAIYDDVKNDFIDATLEQLERVLTIFSSALGSKMNIIVAYQIEGDAVFSEMVFNRLKPKYNVKYINHQMNLSDLKKYYGTVDYHISNRMHSLLVGYKYGSLPVALIDKNEHTKISSALEDNGLENLIIDIYDSNVNEKVKNLIMQRKKIMKKIFNIESINERKIYTILDKIMEKCQTKGKL